VLGFLSLLGITLQSIDPYLLSLTTPRTVSVTRNVAVSTQTGKRASLEDIVRAAEGKRFVYIGEEHTNADSHRWQAWIIRALHEAGRNVIVGVEMYQREKQPVLNLWSYGKLTEEEFLEQSDWKNQWGFDFALYRPIFEFVKDNRLRLVALNIPREWVRKVSREGWESLPPEAKEQLPDVEWEHPLHRRLFEAMMQGHPPGASLEGMYRGQVLWDEAMADSALRYLSRTSVGPQTVFVVLAGNGHVMHKMGINYRVFRRTKEEGITVVTVSIPERVPSRKVNAGVGDFVIGVRGTSSNENPQG
jgi:uncharacterized iron-regulated protein